MIDVKKLFGTDARTALMWKNILVSFLIKGWSGVVTLLLVPVTLHCLGDYKNGIWITVSTMLIWIDNLDIGLGNGMRNKLAAHLAHGDTTRARECVTSTFVMLVVIIIPVMLVTIGLAHAIDLYGFLNVDPGKVSDLTQVVIVSIIFVAATFIFKFIGNLYLGLQLPAVNNLLVTAGHTLALVGTYAVYLSGSRSLMQVAIVNTCAPLVAYLLAYPYTFYVRYPELRPSIKFFNLQAVKGLFNIGVKFFVLQIAGILLFMTSNILISKLFDPAMVTPYQIAYRYFSIVMMLFTIVSAPFWTATTDAWERGDKAWVTTSRRSMDKIMLVVAAALALMTLVSAPVYKVWVGDVEIPFTLSVLMAIYMYVILASMSYSYYLNGMGALTLQLILTLSAAVVFVPLTWIAVKGVSARIETIVVTMILVNLPGLLVNILQYRRIMQGKARGIWLK